MKNLSYYKPATFDGVLDVLDQLKGEKNVHLVAGGTDLIPKMKSGTISPLNIIELREISYCKGITQVENEIHIGSLCTFEEIINSQLIFENVPFLSRACREIGSPQIRAVGTIGGNIANASPSGDTIPPLYVLDADVEIMSLDSQRTVPIRDLFLDPGKTILKNNEIITRIIFKMLPKNTNTFFYKIGQRQALSISKISMAGAVVIEDETVKDVRLAFGAVGPTVLRAVNCEKFLLNKNLDKNTIKDVMAIAESEVSPISDIRSTKDYRSKMAGVLLKKALDKFIIMPSH